MKKLFAFLFVLLLFVLAACGQNDESGIVRIIIKDAESTVLFDEELDFTKTDTLIGLLENHEEITMKGETSEYGLYITELCGVKAEEAYWAVYIDGEYAMVGVSQIPLTNQTEIEFILTPFE